MKWSPHAYQKRAMKFMVERPAAGLFLDPGLGKTSITLGAFLLLRKAGLVKRMLVVAPLRVCHLVWPNEVKKWDEFADLKVIVLHGKDKNKLINEPADVHVINPEGLAWYFAHLKPAGQHFAPEMLVVDESTMFKNTRSLRFKLLKAKLNLFKRRYILTGTPAPNGLMDLFGQIFLLDGGAALGTFITRFRERHFFKVGNWTWVLQKGAEQAIYKAIQHLVLRLSAEDYLDLPPLIMNTVEVQLPPEARSLYRRLESDMLLELEEGAVVARNAGALSTKCRQLAGGAVYTEQLPEDYVPGVPQAEVRDWTVVHDEKLNALEELLEDLGGKPTLVAYEYDHERLRIEQHFKHTERLGLSPAVDAKTVVRWNRGEIPWLLVQPQSVGHGLNLQGAGRVVIWFQMTWNLELYDQLIRRVWRQGQQHRVFVHHLVARGTVDEDVLMALKAKTRTQNDLLEALKKRRN